MYYKFEEFKKMTSVRLNKELEDELEQLSRLKNKSRSVIIKEALVEYMAKEKLHTTPYEIGEKYFGKQGSGQKDLSVTYKSRIRSKIRDKRSH